MSANLPSTYQEVEYIETYSPGPYIRTGIYPTVGLEIYAAAQWLGSSNDGYPCLIGSYYPGTKSGCYIRANVNYQAWELGAGTSTSNSLNYIGSLNQNASSFQARFYGGSNELVINGVTRISISNSYPTGQEPELSIFGRWNNGYADNLGGFKLYSMQILINGALNRNFVPCYRRTDGVAGLYDTYQGKFYTNSGSGGFTFGPAVIEIPKFNFSTVKGLTIPVMTKRVTLTNLVPDGSFEDVANNWNVWLAEPTDTSQAKDGTRSLKLGGDALAATRTAIVPINGHKYYGREYIKTAGQLDAADCRFEMCGAVNGVEKAFIFGWNRGNYPTWTIISDVITIDGSYTDGFGVRTFTVGGTVSAWVDSIVVIDLTAACGAGNEPSKEWCDANIPYFSGSHTLDIPLSSPRQASVTEIKDASGRVLWTVSGGKVILQVEKIISNTKAAETTYENEEFILLDIYPKTNGTVSVTYGGLTKTITDTSGAADPNAQQVFFGTFNGVSDSVATPASGELTIDGDCVAFAIGSYNNGEKILGDKHCGCITAVTSFGKLNKIIDYAFGGGLLSTACLNLTSIDIPGTVSTIGIGAFYGCNGLTSVTMKYGVTSINSQAFISCTGLTSVTIPSSVTSIAGNIFQSCNVNNPVTIDSKNTLYKIDGNCLIANSTNTLLSGFNNSTIPSSVTSIGGSAFHGCTGLTSVTIPSSVTTIGSSAFSSCTGLTSVTIPSSVTTIGSSAFSSCTGLTSINIPAGVTTIESSTFYSCKALTSISIPTKVTAIGNSAFSSCEGLTSVTIPSSVTSIGDSAFSGCTGLTDVTFANTSGWYVTETQNGDASTGTAVNVSDPVNNVTLITDTYKSFYWYRS